MPVLATVLVTHRIVLLQRHVCSQIYFSIVFSIPYRDLLSILTLSMLWKNNSETKEVRQSCTGRFDFAFGIEIRMPICQSVSFSPISKLCLSSFVFFPLFLFLFKKNIFLFRLIILRYLHYTNEKNDHFSCNVF